MKKFVLVILTIVFVAGSAFGQERETKKLSGPRRQLATIIFCGLGGAVLGLSTLSFYGRPQEHLVNIAVGFAVGVIAGTAFSAYSTATTREMYDDGTVPQEGQQPGAQLQLPSSSELEAAVGQGYLIDSPARKWSLHPDIQINTKSDNPFLDRAENRYGATLEIYF